MMFQMIKIQFCHILNDRSYCKQAQDINAVDKHFQTVHHNLSVTILRHGFRIATL